MKVLVLKTNPELFIDVNRLGNGVYTKEIPPLFNDDTRLEVLQKMTIASDGTIDMIEFQKCHVVSGYMMNLIITKLELGHPEFSKILREKFGIVE